MVLSNKNLFSNKGIFFQVDASVVFLTMILSNGACMLILLAVLEGL